MFDFFEDGFGNFVGGARLTYDRAILAFSVGRFAVFFQYWCPVLVHAGSLNYWQIQF